MFSVTQSRNWSFLNTGFLVVVCILIPAFVVGLALVLEQNVILLLLLAPAIVAMIYRLPHLALVIVSLSILFIEALHFSLGVLPLQVTWLADAAIAILAVRVFVFNRPGPGETSQEPFRLPLLMFAGLFLSSALINFVSPIVTLVTIRQYFKYIILYLAITSLPFSSRSLSWLMRLFFLLILVQVPIVVICFILGVREDALSGGLGAGGTAPLGVMCIAAANMFLSKYIHNGRLSDLLKFAAVSSVPAISEIKFGVLLLPFSIVCTMMLAFSENRKRTLVTVVISAMLFLCVIATYARIYPETFGDLGSWSWWRDYANQEYESDKVVGNVYLGRMARMRVAWTHATKDLAAAIVGVGPGQTSDSVFEAGKGSLYDTILGSASTQHFATVLLELGFPGLILSLWILLRLPRGLVRLYKAPIEREDKALVCGLFGTSVILIAYVFYMPVLFYADSTAYLFWLSAAYLSVSQKEMKERQAA